jgi:hypothetical protein
MVYFYHKNRDRLAPRDNLPMALRKAFGQVLGVGPGTKYCGELKKYYDGL